MAFNKEQLEAINQRDSSILVSAPAGSGKTKILVSRIIKLLEEGYSISDFLVLTFTEAAGNEMKQRLVSELNDLVSSDIDETLKNHLQEQIILLPNAYITNFHGFCSLLLKKYGYLVNVMPGFEINSDPEMIKREVLDECLTYWIKDYPEFFSLYFPGYNLDEFKNLLLKIDSVSHSIDHFYEYVEHIHKDYYSFNDINDWPLFNALKQIFIDEAYNALDKLAQLYEYACDHGLEAFYERPDEQKPKDQLLSIPYDSYYEYLTNMIDSLSKQITYDTFVSLLNTKVPSAYRMSWKEVDNEVKKGFNKLKDTILKPFKERIKEYIIDDEKDFIEKLRISYKPLNRLLNKGGLLDQFQQAYALRKKELNQLDFNDLEKYTHLLLEEQHGIVQILYNQLKELMVDEYQDTNQIQESLLLKISTYNNPNIPLFMVGDMKQSIYRFRQADPSIFLEKYNTFSTDKEEVKQTHTRRIDLVFNYRSSKIVLDSINFIFNNIMDTTIGGLEYYNDDSARLNYDYIGKGGNRDDFFKDRHLDTEILIDIYDPKSIYDKEQYEAHMVAQKIIDMKNNLHINHKPISYKDIVVLMRSTTAFLTFKKVFDQYQIPNRIVLSQGLLSTNEIQNIIQLLKAIHNPYNDLSLLSVLVSPYNFSYIDENIIAKLRINHKDLSLYECLSLSDNQKFVQFLNIFNELKEYSYNHSPYDLLMKFDEISEYRLFVSQLLHGHQRKVNIDLFYEIIHDLQIKTPYLEDLIIELEGLSDRAPASCSSDNDDAVEFMTIHKSKGLEYPIVFVCNTHKKFNMQDSKERMMLDKSYGYALKPRDKISNDTFTNVTVEYDNIYRSLIGHYQKNESINEEMRILYVALTRASSKLILTGVIKDIEEVKDIQRKLITFEHTHSKKEVILMRSLRNVNTYLQWILASILRHPDIIKQCLNHHDLKFNAQKFSDQYNQFLTSFDSTEHSMFSLSFTTDEELEKNIPAYSSEIKITNNEEQLRYDQYIYPYPLDHKETLAVTALAHVDDDHYVSHNDQEETLTISAADKGTLVHLLMSYLSFKDDHVETLIEQLYQEELIDENGKEILYNYINHIQDFVDSDIYQQISQADYIYKEKYFSYYDKQREQIIHGIFDLVFIKDEQVYVLDYKTDRVSQNQSIDLLIDKHQFQLNYYKQVLDDMYHKQAKAIVYYLHINKAVEF